MAVAGMEVPVVDMVQVAAVILAIENCQTDTAYHL